MRVAPLGTLQSQADGGFASNQRPPGRCLARMEVPGTNGSGTNGSVPLATRPSGSDRLGTIDLPKWIGARSERSDFSDLHSLSRFRLFQSVKSNSTREDFEVECRPGVGK